MRCGYGIGVRSRLQFCPNLRQNWNFSKADKDFTASDEDVLSISKQLMEQNKEAYEVLAK